jgi:hypothetical protein
MDVVKVSGQFNSNSSQRQNQSNNSSGIDSVDLDWGDMIVPSDIMSAIPASNPYVISKTDCSTISEDDNSETEDIELSDIDTVATFDDLEILRRSSLMARELKLKIVGELNKDLDTTINQIIEYVYWLKQNMIILSERIGQEFDEKSDKPGSDCSSDESLERDRPDTIGRNSYKFCDFGHGCSFGYSLEDKRDCYSQHFVYPLILSDIHNLVDHILTDDGTCSPDIQIKEVITSINTITYVINHMYNELVDLKNNNQIGYDYYKNRKLSLKCVTKNMKRRHRKKL